MHDKAIIAADSSNVIQSALPDADDGYNPIPQAQSMLNCKVSKVFHQNVSIWYSSQVILIDSTRFFCYFLGCLNRSYAAGYYKWDGDTLKFSTNAKVARKIKSTIDDSLKGRLKYEAPSDAMLQMKDGKLYWVRKERG
jgi:hypothetical protein